MSTQKYPMETYHGMVRTPADAIKLFEACRLGLLPRVQRRLSEKERQAIRSGSVFVWDEREAGMRRWTDGKSWSASRVSGSFLTYREMEGKRGGGGFSTARRVSGKTPDSSGRGSDEDQDDGEPDGYRYKADGLMKQSFSITTSNDLHLHLISYYARPGPGESDLIQPVNDRSLRHVIPVKGMYPESSMPENAPVLRQLAQQPPQHLSSHYSHHHQPPPLQTGPHPGYSPYVQPGYSWPPSPIATPPYSHHYTTAPVPYPSQHSQQAPPLGHYSRHSPPPPPGYYAGPAPHHGAAPPPQTLPPYSSARQMSPLPPPPSHYDRLPLPAPQSTRASPPAHAGHSPHSSHSSYGPPSVANSRGLSTSPRSAYHQPPPILPPVTGSPYQNMSPRSRNTLPPVSQSGPLPALNASVASAASAAQTSSASVPAPALTPPYQQKPYYPSEPYASANSPSSTSGASKSSLSALLLPTPTSSELGSTHNGSARSASSSPRHPGASLVGSGASISGPGALAPLSQQYLQPAPSGEDSRALSRLDKKFCI